MNELNDQGVCSSMISSEMGEGMGMSERNLDMSEGRITGELQEDELEQARILGMDAEI